MPYSPSLSGLTVRRTGWKTWRERVLTYGPTEIGERNCSQSLSANTPRVVKRVTIAKGLEGARQTLALMRSLSLSSSKAMPIRNMAMYLTGHLRQKDFKAEACCCLKYVRDNIRYVRDIRSVEVLQYPTTTMRIEAGDCDDKSTLLASLLASIGHRVRFIVVSPLPNVFSHVWVQVFVGKNWLDLEATEPLPCGERIPSDARFKYLTLEL